MARIKDIKGKYTTSGKIQITDYGSGRLSDGQKVLLYKPTDKEIISSFTGRKLGRKEKVIDTGIVKTIDGKVYVYPNSKLIRMDRKGLVTLSDNKKRGGVKPRVTLAQQNMKMYPTKVYVKVIDE